MTERSIVNTLALGGLLHDIGKFRERAGAPPAGTGGMYSHEPHSRAFVAARAAAFSEPDRIAAMALGHHDPQVADEKVVAIADRLASAERAASGSGDAVATGRARRPLLSLLARTCGHTPAVG